MAENVRVVTEGISHVTPHGMLLSSGEVIDFDIIICATGFDLSFRPRFPVLGRNGASLQEQWTRSIPQAYMSLAVENFPNYFRKLSRINGSPGSSNMGGADCFAASSFPRSKRTNRSWVCSSHCRACHQVHDQRDEENANTRDQVFRAETRCRSRLQRAYPRIHGPECVVSQMQQLVQERQGGRSCGRPPPGKSDPLVSHAGRSKI